MTRVLTIAAVALSFAARADEAIVMGHTRAADGGALRCLLGVARASGLEVEERILSTDATLVDALGSGEVDVAVGDAEAAIAAWARGLPVVVVAGFAPSHARIVARRALEAVRVADLVHRRIGVPRGGSLELLLLGELHAASLGWSDGRGGDVQLVHLAPADLGPALRSGYVDAIVQSEPEASLAIRAGDGVEVPRTTGDRPAVLLATGRAYAERRRLAALVRSLVDAAAWRSGTRTSPPARRAPAPSSRRSGSRGSASPSPGPSSATRSARRTWTRRPGGWRRWAWVGSARCARRGSSSGSICWRRRPARPTLVEGPPEGARGPGRGAPGTPRGARRLALAARPPPR